MRTQPIPLLRKDRTRTLRKKRLMYILIGIAAFFVLAIGLYFVPPIHSRLYWRLQDLWADVRFFFNPPEEELFIPSQQEQVDLIVTQTMAALLTPSATALPSGEPTATPTITPTPLPQSAHLDVPVYVNQCLRWNYCGPANLTMALKFWGWNGTRDDVAAVIKPGVQDPSLDFITQGRYDLNVMPYEMEDFVNENTNLRALYRVGGGINLIKNMLIHGFPVIIEKGIYEYTADGEYAWMGHYAFVTGYNDALGGMIWQDTYPNACPEGASAMELERLGRDKLATYTEFINGWRAFNYVFIIVYPEDKEEEIYSLLGPWNDSNWAAQNALTIANQEIPTIPAENSFFSWFNKGTSLVLIKQYQDAAIAYDSAFRIYGTLGDNAKPKPRRITWYQDGPYEAYYYAGRYPDVVNLANNALSLVKIGPYLQEALYWRGLAEFSLGDTEAAFRDVREALRLNPNFKLAWEQLSLWGISP